jgi:hypothetical protein
MLHDTVTVSIARVLDAKGRPLCLFREVGPSWSVRTTVYTKCICRPLHIVFTFSDAEGN